MTSPNDALQRLGYELDGVLADTSNGGRFDDVCRGTVQRVRDELAALSTSEVPESTKIADFRRQLAAERDHSQRLQRQLDAILRTDAPLSETPASASSERVMGGIVSTPGARSGTRTDAQAEVMPSCVQPASVPQLRERLTRIFADDVPQSESAACNMDVIVSHERHEHLLACEAALRSNGGSGALIAGPDEIVMTIDTYHEFLSYEAECKLRKKEADATDTAKVFRFGADRYVGEQAIHEMCVRASDYDKLAAEVAALRSNGGTSDAAQSATAPYDIVLSKLREMESAAEGAENLDSAFTIGGCIQQVEWLKEAALASSSEREGKDGDR